MLRSARIDFLRGLAIILMVLGHCIQFGQGEAYLNSGCYFENAIFKTIYSFHMPLFACISGYLIYNQLQRAKSFASYLKKQFVSVIVPVFSWVLIIDIVVISICTKGQSVDLFLLEKYLLTSINSLWFLWAVFYSSIIISVIRFFFKDNILLMISIIFLSLFLPDSHNVGLYVWTYPFFVIGYLVNRHKLNDVVIGGGKLMAIFCLSLSVFVILLTLYTTNTYVYISGTEVDIMSAQWWKQLLKDIYRIIIGIIGCIVVIIMSYYIPTHKMKVIPKIGQISMGIYIISGYLIFYVLTMLTKEFNPSLLVAAIETIIMLLFCSLLTILIAKSPILNTLLLGGRKINKHERVK